MKRAPEEEGEAVELKPLTDDQLLLTVPWVKGFVLKEKKWYSLAVSHIKPIVFNESFDNLVLPHQEKDLLLAFAQSKVKSTEIFFDDFVSCFSSVCCIIRNMTSLEAIFECFLRHSGPIIETRFAS